MARDVETGVQTELQASFNLPFLAAKLEFDSGDVLLWNGYGPRDVLGETYTGAGHLVGISAISETREIKTSQVTLQLTGIPASFIAIALLEAYQDRPVTIYKGFIDDTGGTVPDPWVHFAGVMDQMILEDESNTATILLTVENRNILFERPPGGTYTHEDQQSRYPGDKFFEFLPGLRDKTVRWGFGQ